MVFDEVVTNKKSIKKKSIKPETEETKDKENYIEYRPSDYASERGWVAPELSTLLWTTGLQFNFVQMCPSLHESGTCRTSKVHKLKSCDVLTLYAVLSSY